LLSRQFDRKERKQMKITITQIDLPVSQTDIRTNCHGFKILDFKIISCEEFPHMKVRVSVKHFKGLYSINCTFFEEDKIHGFETSVMGDFKRFYEEEGRYSKKTLPQMAYHYNARMKCLLEHEINEPIAFFQQRFIAHCTGNLDNPKFEFEVKK
jgi:hypothetical protein